MKTLLTLGFIEMRVEYREAQLTSSGFTIERHYRLKAPFRTESTGER